ncbi:transcriptional regulator [Escherichia coli]|nr:transcriptional regulator [Escherichia coli]
MISLSPPTICNSASGRREDFPQPAVRCGTDGLRAGVVNPPGLTCAALPLTSEGRQRIKR